MTDKELLVYSAKAAGIDGWEHYDGSGSLLVPDPDDEDSAREWNPLTDDGDAFRLAVSASVDLPVMKNKALYSNKELCAATRRALVGVVAEIGKEM